MFRILRRAKIAFSHVVTMIEWRLGRLHPTSDADKVMTRSNSVTMKLQEALEDVKEGRVYSVDPQNYRDGFRELLEKTKNRF